jgi:hypothetical protein
MDRRSGAFRQSDRGNGEIRWRMLYLVIREAGADLAKTIAQGK